MSETALTTTAVPAQDRNPFKTALTGATKQITSVLPEYLTPERMIQLAVMAVYKNSYLQKCNPHSVVAAVVEAAAAGLEPCSPLKQGDIIPVWNNKLNAYEAQFRPRYGGLMQLARNTGQVVFEPPRVVYLQDEFSVELGDNPRLVHVPARQTDAPQDADIIAAYSVATVLPFNIKTFDVMYRWEIEKARASSDMEKLRGQKKVGPTPWELWYGEMCKKTVVKRHSKNLPMGNSDSARRLATAIEMDDRDYVRTEEPPPAPRRPLFSPAVSAVTDETPFDQAGPVAPEDGNLFDNPKPDAVLHDPKGKK